MIPRHAVVVVALVSCIWLLSCSVHAELLVHEPFDYAVGDVDGQDGGTGFDGAWNADPGFADLIQVVQPDSPLSYTVPGGGTLNGGDRALRLLNDTPDTVADVQELITRDLADPIESDDIYFSYLYRFAAGEVNDNDFVVWWFNERQDPTPNIGLKGNRGNGSGPEDLMARLDNNANKMDWAPDVDISEEAGTMGQDFLVVGHLYRAGNSDDPLDYDQYDLWVNPSISEKDTPHAVAPAEPGDSLSIDVFAIGMRAYSQEPDDEMLWDELRFGTTWEDVVRPLGSPVLQAGDANMDFEFNQLDLVKVQVAAKYLSGQAATWGEGDWDGAPGGTQGDPPAGNGQFDQMDIIAALAGGVYLTGPYTAIGAGGKIGDAQTSVVYNVGTGELSVDAPAGVELTSINIDSASGIFTGNLAENLGGSFDNDADNNIFKATFGGSFGSLSFGTVAQPGLAQDLLLDDLSVVGSLAGGGDLGDVDLVYIPEPASFVLFGLGLLELAIVVRCRCRNTGLSPLRPEGDGPIFAAKQASF